MSFFKAYDMRGTFGVDFDLDTVYRVGKALPAVVFAPREHTPPRWLVGRDCRATSDAVHDALVKGLVEAGAEVTDLGLCTTPMVYFFTASEDFDGSVMITASHNPPADNGLKVSMRTALPVGYANGLNEVERLVNGEATAPSLRQAELEDIHSEATGTSLLQCDGRRLQAYIAWQIQHSSIRPFANSPIRQFSHSPILPFANSPIPPFANLSFAIDCSDGMASLLAHDLFPNAVFINDTPDGTFPHHSPNPLKAEAREQLAALVRERHLDCGVIFDGDADRVMFVDEKGDFVQPDYLIPIVARATLKAGAGAPPLQTGAPSLGAGAPSPPQRVIHDVRTSRGVIETLREMGCEPVMVPVGHAFAKPILRKIGAVCGGELAGHYYFSEFFGCDSGILAASRVLSEIAAAKAKGLTFSQMMAPIVSRYANSGELNFKVADKDAAIARVLNTAAEKLPRELSRSTMDGIRIEYAEGWINVRKSNTEPYLRLIVEADTRERLADWVSCLRGAIENDR